MGGVIDPQILLSYLQSQGGNGQVPQGPSPNQMPSSASIPTPAPAAPPTPPSPPGGPPGGPPQQGPQITGIKGYLSNILYNMGEAAKVHLGMPTDAQTRLAQIKSENETMTAQAGQIKSQAEAKEALARGGYYGAMANEFQAAPLAPEEAGMLGLPAGTQMTAKDKAAAFKQLIQNKGKTDVQGLKDQGALTRVALQNGMPMLITPQMAQIAGQPDVAGQYLSGKSLANFMKMFQGTGAGVKDLGADGMWAVDRMGNKLQQVTVGSPSLERASAYARARAENTPVDVFDSEGNLATISQAQQLQTGAPKASTVFQQQGPTSAVRTSGLQAAAVSAHIPDIKNEVDQLAARGDLGPVMGRLNTFINSGYGGSDPLVAKFVADMSLVKSGTLKAHFGARGGQQMYDRWDKVLNTSQEPEAIKGALDGFKGWLDKYGDIGKFKPQLPNAPPSRVAPSPPAGGPPPGAKIRDYTQLK